MTVLVDEIGAIAAENVETILGTAKIAPTGPRSDVWSRLAEGGWTTLTADADSGLGLRGIQEVARITGRFSVSTPLVTTLLAARWFDLPEDGLLLGASVALPWGAQRAFPYIADGVTLLEPAGTDTGLSPSSLSRDDFSQVMPLGLTPGSALAPELKPDHRAELVAVLAAVTVGCADAVLARSVEWSQTRQQFGQPIKSFQAIRHHLADMHIAREQAWTAALAAGHDQDRADSWSAYACGLAKSAIELGIQVHGGIGFTWEVGLQHFLCHVLQIEALIGQSR